MEPVIQLPVSQPSELITKTDSSESFGRKLLKFMGFVLFFLFLFGMAAWPILIPILLGHK